MHLWPKHVSTTYFGSKMACDVRDMVQATIIHLGVWEPNVSRVFERLLKPGDVAIDVGANVGYYSLLFSQLVECSGWVVAFEALPKTVEIFRRNVELNQASNINIANVAVTDRTGDVTVFASPATNIGMSTISAEKGFSAAAVVPGVRLTDFINAEEMRRTTLIKIDVEGAEVPIVEDILDHLSQFSSRLCLAIEADETNLAEWAGLFERLRQNGFFAYDLQNEYDWIELLANPFPEPMLVTEAPSGRTDLLFTRMDPDQLREALGSW